MPRSHDSTLPQNGTPRKSANREALDSTANVSGTTHQVREQMLRRWIVNLDSFRSIQKDFAGMSLEQIESQVRIGTLARIAELAGKKIA